MQVSDQMPIGDARKLAAYVGVVASVLAFVVLLLPWQSVDFDDFGFSESRNGLHGIGYVTLLGLVAIVGAHLVIVAVSEPPIEYRVLGLVLMVAGVLVPLSTLVNVLDDSLFRTSWAWLGLLLSIPAGGAAIAAGALLTFVPREADATPVGDVRAFIQRGLGSGSLTVPPPSASVPAGWYDDPERPGAKRWWDGSQWGMTDTDYSSTADRS